MDDKEITVEEPITDYGKLDLSRNYTYLDYLRWQFADRVELIRGKIVKMAPAPGEQHQRISSHLHRAFANAFHGSACRVPCSFRCKVGSAKI